MENSFTEAKKKPISTGACDTDDDMAKNVIVYLLCT